MDKYWWFFDYIRQQKSPTFFDTVHLTHYFCLHRDVSTVYPFFRHATSSPTVCYQIPPALARPASQGVIRD